MISVTPITTYSTVLWELSLTLLHDRNLEVSFNLGLELCAPVTTGPISYSEHSVTCFATAFRSTSSRWFGFPQKTSAVQSTCQSLYLRHVAHTWILVLGLRIYHASWNLTPQSCCFGYRTRLTTESGIITLPAKHWRKPALVFSSCYCFLRPGFNQMMGNASGLLHAGKHVLTVQKSH